MSEEDVVQKDVHGAENAFFKQNNRRGIGGMFREFLVTRYHIPDRLTTRTRGLYPDRFREVIDVAKAHKDTLRDEVLAVGPKFDNGMSHLDQYEAAISQYEDKRLDDHTYREWQKTALAMWEDGFKDVMHTVESTKAPVGIEMEQTSTPLKQDEYANVVRE